MTAERPMCRKGLHYIDEEGSTYTLRDGRTRCRRCRTARKRRQKERRLAAEAETARRLAEEQALRIAWASRRRAPGWLGREAAALHRLAVRVREDRGVMPGAPGRGGPPPAPPRVRRQGRGG